MFSSTVHQVVRSLGKDTLLPVPSLEVSDNIFPLSLVVKEYTRHCLFWTKQKCLTTEFKLSDILEDSCKEPSVKINSNVLCKNFNRTTDISLKGKFGVELSKELFDINLEGARSVVVKSPLGDLVKDEVDLQGLLREIRSRQINLNHPLVKPLVNEKILCIVTGMVKLADDATLSSEVKWDESGKIGGTFSCTSRAAVSADADEEVDEDKTKTMKVVKGTPLVYRIYELLVSTKDGSFDIQVNKGSKGGFTTDSVADMDEVDAVADSFSGIETSGDPASIFQGLVKLPERQKEQMRNVTRGIMEMPQSIQPLSELLNQAEQFIDNNIEKTTNLDSLRQKVGSMDDDLQQFLTLVGFNIKEGNVEYPRAMTDVFEASQLLVTLLDEFGDEQLDALVRCVDDGETALDLIKILEKTQNSRIQRLDLTPEDAAILTTDTAKNFIDAVDLKVDNNVLVLSEDNRMDMNAAYFVLYALYGK